MKKMVAPFLTALILLSACAKKGPEAPKLPVRNVCVEQAEMRKLELEAENVPFWLENGARGRILVRLSNIEGLQPVDEGAMDNLAGMADKKDIAAVRAAALGDRPAFTSLNTLFVAKRLGIVDEVYWVVPIFGSIADQDIEGFKKYLKDKLPGREKDIDGLKLAGNVVQGAINGVPLKLMGLEDVQKIDKPVLLSLDGSYFAALYKDEKQTRMLSFISGFFITLRKWGLRSDMVTFSMSNADGNSPLKFRFVGSYLRELFTDPKKIDADPPALWTEREDAWKAEQRSYKEAVPIYKKIAKEFPADAASRFDLSVAYFKLGRFDESKKELDEATKLDEGYGIAYRELARATGAKGAPDNEQRQPAAGK